MWFIIRILNWVEQLKLKVARCANVHFSRSKHLVIHMKNHSQNKCDACTSANFELIFAVQLRMHIINHMDGLPYHYAIRGKNFRKSKHLVIHMKNHSQNKDVACTLKSYAI